VTNSNKGEARNPNRNTMSELKLDNAQVEELQPTVVGLLVFSDILGKPNHGEANPEEKIPEWGNISFLYQGGTFKGRFADPKIAKELLNKVGNNALQFSRVELSCRPTRGAFKNSEAFQAIHIKKLEVKGKVVYQN
jgi:hypothetical protein